MLVYRIIWYCTVLDKKKAAFSGLLFYEGGDGETRTGLLIHCLIIVLFFTISNIPPNIPPFCTSQNLSPASRTRCPHSEGANSAGWGLHGVDVSNRAFVGLFCNPADAGEWSAGCYGRGWAVCRCSLKIPVLPVPISKNPAVLPCQISQNVR